MGALNVGKLCALDLDPGVCFQSNVADLSSNVFAFAITVGPDKEGTSTARLNLDVFRDVLPFLRLPSEPSRPNRGVTHLDDLLRRRCK